MLTKCAYCGFLHEDTDANCLTGDMKLDPVVEKVRADLHRRSQLGIAKYGTALADNLADHRAKLQHAYEEALDLANYLAWAIMELDSPAPILLDVIAGRTPEDRDGDAQAREAVQRLKSNPVYQGSHVNAADCVCDRCMENDR